MRIRLAVLFSLALASSCAVPARDVLKFDLLDGEGLELSPGDGDSPDTDVPEDTDDTDVPEDTDDSDSDLTLSAHG